MKKGLYIASLFALCAGAAFATDVPPDFVGGNTDGSDRNSSITSNVSGSYFRIVGGNQNANAPTGNVNGDITLNLDNVDVSYKNGFIGGGNLLNYLDNPADNPDTMGYVSGKVTVNFNSGTLSASQGLYGGNTGGIKSQNNNYVGSVEMNLNGGNVIGNDGAYVAGSGAAYSNVKGDVVINMNAGEINEIVGVNGAGKVGGKVAINAKGGKLGNLYAGGQGVNSVIDGGTNILLGGDVAVSGDVYAGGWYNDREGNRSTLKNGTKITLTDNATVAGTINGGGVNGTTIVEGKKVLDLGTADAAYKGTSALKVADFDTINVAKGTTASVEKIEQNLTGAVAGSRTFVNEGANFTVEGDIVNTLENATNNGSFVAGLTSVKGDLQSGGSAIVKGTVKTVINGADTKLKYFYGGNGGNQKGSDPDFRAIMDSSVGAVDVTVNDGSIDMIVGNGAMLSDVNGNVGITVNGGTIGGIYGAGSNGLIGGDVNITVNGGTFKGDQSGAYTIAIAAGGANNANDSIDVSTISGSTNVVIGGDAKLNGDVFGGGWGGYTGKKQGGVIKGGTNITLKDNATISGTIYGGGIAGNTVINGKKTLNIGTADAAYNGASALKIADFDTINVAKGTTASVEKIEQNLTGAVAGSRTFVNEGANFTVEGDIVNTLENGTNHDSFVAGLTSSRGDSQSGGSAIVKGTVRTIIDGADTSIDKFYGGNGGNQKSGSYTVVDAEGNEITKTGTVPLMKSTVGGVDITVNNGKINGFILASGAMYSDVEGDVNVVVNNGTIGVIEGGACGGNIGGNVNIAVNGGTVSSIAAGGCASSIPPYKSTTGIVGGSTNVVIGGDAKVLGDVYGGGWSDGEAWRDTVKGDTTITLKDNATVGGTLYGGSMGGTGTIEGSKNLNIGTAESAYNGASALKVADFQKIGIVNGSAEFASYTQAAEGTLITISNGALLTATVASAGQFSNTSVENGGSLVLKRGELADSAAVSFKDYTGSGKVSAFGGTFANGTFTAGRSAVASAGLTVGTGASDVQSVRFGDGALSLDFDVSTMGENEITIKSIAKSTDTTGIDGTVLAAFDIDASYDYTNQWSVLLSVAISLDGIDEASLKAWHKGADGNWTLTDKTVSVADGIAGIVADGFSSWAISGAAIPEPAEWAAILGALALAIAACRRRSGR